jgi:hypothetical protein
MRFLVPRKNRVFGKLTKMRSFFVGNCMFKTTKTVKKATIFTTGWYRKPK